MMVLSIIDIALLVAGLAVYLFVIGSQLTRIAANLEECGEIVRSVVRDAEAIEPGLDHLNRTGGVVAGALPLLYGMAEGIVTGVTPIPAEEIERGPARPASGRRRSRLHEGVGYDPGELDLNDAARHRAAQPAVDPQVPV
jgi:hypothetical protein